MPVHLPALLKLEAFLSILRKLTPVAFFAIKTILFEYVVNVLNAAFSSIISAFIYVCNKEFPAQSAGLECEQNNSLWFIGNRCTWGCLQGASRYY